MTVSIRETTTTLAANTPALIAQSSLGCSVFIIANNGTGSMVWKCGSEPASATDGTPLDPGSSKQGTTRP